MCQLLIPMGWHSTIRSTNYCHSHAGDPFQLGPVVHSVTAQTLGLAKSHIELLSRVHSTRHMVMLTRNYRYDLKSYSSVSYQNANNHSTKYCRHFCSSRRSNTNLLELPSRLFYGASLISNAREDELQPPAWKVLENDDSGNPLSMETKSTLFYGVRGNQASSFYFNDLKQ